MVLTSFFYFWIRVGEPLLNFPQGHCRAPTSENPDAVLDGMGPQPPQPLKLDALAAIVRKDLPDFDIRFVNLPEAWRTGHLQRQYRGVLRAEPVRSLRRSLSRRDPRPRPRPRRLFVFLCARADRRAAFRRFRRRRCQRRSGSRSALAVTTGLAMSGVIVFETLRAASRSMAGQIRAGRRVLSILKP